jgi:hypothetical protein
MSGVLPDALRYLPLYSAIPVRCIRYVLCRRLDVRSRLQWKG